MKIRKAVITAASPTQNTLPLQNVVDRNGEPKTALQLILDEAIGAGIEEVCVVICPDDEPRYRISAGSHASFISFVEQHNPRGYGDALFRSAEFVGDDPFLHLVGDHLYISQSDIGCAKQLVEVAQAENCAVSAVNPTREHLLHMFGAVGARRVANRSGLYQITNVLEKPTPTQAEQELVVAGLRNSHYLCLFGQHVLTPTVMDVLRSQVENAKLKSVQLSPALGVLAKQERYLACEIDGQRYNIGAKYGLLISQLALALSGKERDLILTELLDLVATHKPNGI